jgi:hypothetical protein
VEEAVAKEEVLTDNLEDPTRLELSYLEIEEGIFSSLRAQMKTRGNVHLEASPGAALHVSVYTCPSLPQL